MTVWDGEFGSPLSKEGERAVKPAEMTKMPIKKMATKGRAKAMPNKHAN